MPEYIATCFRRLPLAVTFIFIGMIMSDSLWQKSICKKTRKMVTKSFPEHSLGKTMLKC